MNSPPPAPSPIWFPEIKNATERIIRKRRKYPGIPVKIPKRDISNAFKRVPLRPGYVAIFCHQFSAQSSGLAQDSIVGWLALPFGFAASPAIFAMCTDAIQKVHHIGKAHDGSWPGWEPFRSEIFDDDAIFVEADVGNILEETVKTRGGACRGLFGLGSANRGKVDLEGSWGANGMVLRFDIDTELGSISVPRPKGDGARIYLISAEFAVGSQHVTLKALQTLRDTCRIVSWNPCLGPVVCKRSTYY